ncbi:MAG: Gfo/Idh/MocA family oxidoreductase [Planctomycetes bacterium]|nr:Gfo/Idh/MocA family oxidoreductase [Planctomycetota bacterium]
MKTLNLALLGCGGITKSHRAAFAEIPEIKPFVMVDLNEELAKEVAEETGAKHVTTDWREAVAMDEVDIVDICLPHTIHSEPAVEAAKNKEHIFAEKPMATTLADCDAMIQAAEENGVTLAVGQVLRFREANEKARELLRAGRIGQPLNHIRRRVRYTPDPPRHTWARDYSLSGGWELYGFGPHEMDIMLWLADSNVSKLWARGKKIIAEKDDVDDITALFEFENGAMGTLMLSENIHKGGWDQCIGGTEGSMYITTNAIDINGEIIDGLDHSRAMFKQWREFIDAIIEKREPSHSGRNVRPSYAALEAIRRAVDTGELIDVTAL